MGLVHCMSGTYGVSAGLIGASIEGGRHVGRAWLRRVVEAELEHKEMACVWRIIALAFRMRP